MLLPTPFNVIKVDELLKRLPEAVEPYRRMVTELGTASINIERGRQLLRGLLGQVWVVPRDGYLVAKMGLELQPLSGSSIRGSGGALLRLQTDRIEVELR